MKTLFTVFLILLLGSQSFAQEINLDSTWTIKGQKFQIVLKQNDEANPPLNTSMTLFRNEEVIIADSLWCSWLDIELEDMNDDGYVDLLIYQGSGARANETYNLFLFQEEKNDFKKVKGYDEWPNLKKTEIKGVLAATILTGTIEYRFFEINSNGELADLNISVDEKNYSGRGYKKGMRQVKKLKK